MKYGCVLTAYFTAVRTRFQFALCFMLAFILLSFILLSFIPLSFVLLSSSCSLRPPIRCLLRYVSGVTSLALRLWLCISGFRFLMAYLQVLSCLQWAFLPAFHFVLQSLVSSVTAVFVPFCRLPFETRQVRSF